MISLEELKKIMPFARKRAERHIDAINAAMAEFEVNNVMREAAFLAQTAHESGELRYMRELASGAEYDVGRKAVSLGNTPEDDDDGERLKGRGPIQITGHNNYLACGEALGLDLLANPEMLEVPEHGWRAAGWFWGTNGLNELADKGDFKLITKRINGGYTHLRERLAYYERAKGVLAP